jgi:hypothetical protein
MAANHDTFNENRTFALEGSLTVDHQIGFWLENKIMMNINRFDIIVVSNETSREGERGFMIVLDPEFSSPFFSKKI